MSRKKKIDKAPNAEKPRVSLSKDDRELWDKLVQSLDQLETRATHVIGDDSIDIDRVDRSAQQPEKSEADRDFFEQDFPSESKRPMPKVGNAHRSSANVTKPSTPPPLTSIGAKSARRIRSGAITLDARLDLHGMRQSEAQAALRSFLFRCYAQEQKWVLVITGKGDRPGRERDTYEQEDYGYGVERGVLRRRVPQWLAEPDVRRIVVSYTTAAPHHGGGGALYVELRKKR